MAPSNRTILANRREVPPYEISLDNWGPEDRRDNLNQGSAMFVVYYALGTVTLVEKVVYAVPTHIVMYCINYCML